MKKLKFLAVWIGIALAGYLLGRATATGDVPTLSTVHKEIPLFPAPPKPDTPNLNTAPPKPDRDVIIETPEEGTRPPSQTFTVAGRAKANTGNGVRVKVLSAQNVVLFEELAQVTAGDGEPFGRFSETVALAEMPTENVTVTVALDAKDAEPVTRIVLFGTKDEVDVKVFFANNVDDPDHSCDLVYPVIRKVSGSTAIYRAAIEALLRGPHAVEVSDGYASMLPAGVTLKSVAADSEGVVTADFDDRLGRNVAGSCRVTAIRAQIGATLKQFPEVRDVIISINGESEDILQP